MGPFYSLEFIATDHEMGRGRGLGAVLLRYVLQRADAERRYIFLAAMGPRNREWYSRHGFEDLSHRRYAAQGVAAVADWYFMSRPPNNGEGPNS